MRLFLAALLASTLPLAGCNLYFSGGDDDPDPCDEWGGGDGPWGGVPEPGQAELLRNPQTGQCEDWSWGGGGPWPCDDECGPCVGGSDGSDGTDSGNGSTEPTPLPEPTDEPGGSGDQDAPSGAQAPPPNWGLCESFCTGLDEQTCLATDQCQGIYDQGSDGPGLFRECWETGPEQWGEYDCEGQDAYSCATNDACVAVHENACDIDTKNGEEDPFQACTPGNFISCHNETAPEGCYSDEDCDWGSTCNAADVCLPPPGGDGFVPDVCYGYCSPVDCLPIDVDCPEGFAKICPPNGCEADCICEPIDPGECDGVTLCTMPPPLCESGTTPGIANGCWTGQCIPLGECPDAACTDIQAESMCIARDDCSAYYIGDNCSCDGSGCTCDDWLFDSCASDAP